MIFFHHLALCGTIHIYYSLIIKQEYIYHIVRAFSFLADLHPLLTFLNCKHGKVVGVFFFLQVLWCRKSGTVTRIFPICMVCKLFSIYHLAASFPS